jgi:radical SAM superfamily enzyme YgiQ (UPF0313 family)
MPENFFEYDNPPYRPPNEAMSAQIRVTRGCPWNRCEFCAMYKRTRFEVKPLEEVTQDIVKAGVIYRGASSVFLGDSDNLVRNDLAEIVALVRATFPEAERVTAYARAKTIVKRKMEFLRAVREAGLDRLHLGLESGDPVVLERLGKGATPEEMIEAGRKAREAGFEVSYYVLCGAGGADRWREHALGSARTLTEARPHFIRLRTLTVLEGSPLYMKMKRGEFAIPGPLERLMEVKLLLENLFLEGTYLASDHLTNYLWAGNDIIYRGISGDLPRDKEEMLAHVSRAIALVESTDLEVKDSNQLYQEGTLTTL